MHGNFFPSVVKGIRKLKSVNSLNSFQIFKICFNFVILGVFKSSKLQKFIWKLFPVKFQVNSQNFK